MPKYKKILRWVAGLVMLMGLTMPSTLEINSIMQQIYQVIYGVSFFVFAIALLLF
jgi:hypothetical protein